MPIAANMLPLTVGVAERMPSDALANTRSHTRLTSLQMPRSRCRHQALLAPLWAPGSERQCKHTDGEAEGGRAAENYC